jgi:hypothetical protein
MKRLLQNARRRALHSRSRRSCANTGNFFAAEKLRIRAQFRSIAVHYKRSCHGIVSRLSKLIAAPLAAPKPIFSSLNLLLLIGDRIDDQLHGGRRFLSGSHSEIALTHSRNAATRRLLCGMIPVWCLAWISESDTFTR